MPTYVAFLRAINLGKQRRVAMGKLRPALTDAGYDGVTTHLQSGNVILGSRARSADSVAKTVEKVLRAEFDLEVDVMVRTAAELARVTRDNPFLTSRVPTSALHVGFLKSRPTAAATRALAEADFGRDEVGLRGREIYLKYPNGVAASKMSSTYFERVLGTPATIRTWRVVTRLVELAS